MILPKFRNLNFLESIGIKFETNLQIREGNLKNRERAEFVKIFFDNLQERREPDFGSRQILLESRFANPPEKNNLTKILK